MDENSNTHSLVWDDSLSKVVQVQRWLINRIRLRYYAVGAKVPSVRALAKQLKVSQSTVVQAYDGLVVKGVLISKRGSGFYTLKDLENEAIVKQNTNKSGQSRQKSSERSVNPAMLLDSKWLLRHLLEPLPSFNYIGSGVLPKEYFSDERLSSAMRKVSRQQMSWAHNYGSVQGYEPLREHMAQAWQRFGLQVKEEQIITTLGVASAVDMVTRYLLRSGDTVLVDDPGWFWIYSSLRFHGMRVVGIPRTEHGIDLEVLERILKEYKPKLYITNSVLHNPTSYCLTPANAYQVLRLMENYDCYLLEDDVWSDFHPGMNTGTPPLRYAALDQLQRVFYVSGYSKLLSHGLRVAALAVPLAHVQGIVNIKLFTNIATSPMDEVIVHTVLTDGLQHKCTQKLRERLTQAHQQIKLCMHTQGLLYPQGIVGGLFIWFNTGHDANAIAREAMNHNWLLAPGSLFSSEQNSSTYLRLNVAFTQPAFIEWLADYLKQLTHRQ